MKFTTSTHAVLGLVLAALAPLAFPASSSADVVYGNLGSTGADGLGITNTDITSTAWVAQGFSAGASTDTALQSITLGLFFDNTLTLPLTISLYPDVSGQPGTTALATSSSVIVGNTAKYTFPFTGVTLSPSTTYWVIPATGASWYRTPSEAAPTAQNDSGYQYVGTLITTDNGATYGTVNPGYSISVNAVPEPMTIGLLAVAGLAGGITALRRRR